MGKNGGGCVDVLMVQSAEKIRLSKWEELPLLPVTSLHLFLSLFFVFSVFFASLVSKQLEAFQETISNQNSSHKTPLTSLFADVVEFFLGHPV